jgi:hypothetical protein
MTPQEKATNIIQIANDLIKDIEQFKMMDENGILIYKGGKTLEDIVKSAALMALNRALDL